MARILSMGWTTEAFLKGKKSVTRRNWKDTYANKIKKGDPLTVWNKVPYGKNAKEIGAVEVLDLYKENTRDIPASDYAKEGFKYMESKGLTIQKKHPQVFFNDWLNNGKDMWVLRFKRTR